MVKVFTSSIWFCCFSLASSQHHGERRAHLRSPAPVARSVSITQNDSLSPRLTPYCCQGHCLMTYRSLTFLFCRTEPAAKQRGGMVSQETVVDSSISLWHSEELRCKIQRVNKHHACKKQTQPNQSLRWSLLPPRGQKQGWAFFCLVGQMAPPGGRGQHRRWGLWARYADDAGQFTEMCLQLQQQLSAVRAIFISPTHPLFLVFFFFNRVWCPGPPASTRRPSSSWVTSS